jgi:hypothetical protein
MVVRPGLRSLAGAASLRFALNSTTASGRSHGHRTRDPAERPASERHRAHTHTAVGTPLRTRTSVISIKRSGANSIVDSIRQHAGPGQRERPAAAAATRRRRPGSQRCGNASVGQLAGPPGCSPGPFGACRFESCPAYSSKEARRDQPTVGDGSRFENGRPTRACESDPRSLRAARPALSVQPGVDASLSKKRPRVRVPHGARTTHPPSWSSGQDTRLSTGRSPVRIRLGVRSTHDRG